MPMREYTCTVCNSDWEEYRKDQSDPEQCPTCKCNIIKRKISAGSFSFKHGGFKESYGKR